MFRSKEALDDEMGRVRWTVNVRSPLCRGQIDQFFNLPSLRMKGEGFFLHAFRKMGFFLPKKRIPENRPKTIFLVENGGFHFWRMIDPLETRRREHLNLISSYSLGLVVIFLSTPSPAKDGTSAGVLRPPTKKLHRDIPKTRGLAKRNKKAAGDSVIFLGWAVWKRRSFYLVCFGAEGFFETTWVLMSCFISPHVFPDRCLDVVYFMILWTDWSYPMGWKSPWKNPPFGSIKRWSGVHLFLCVFSSQDSSFKT